MFDTLRFADCVYQDKKGLASTVSIRCTTNQRPSVPHPTDQQGTGGSVLTSTITIFGFGVSPSMIQSNLGPFPSWLTHLEWNDGLASIYDIDFDICAKSSSPTSDPSEEVGSSTTAGSPSGIPPVEKGPENEAVIIGGTASSLQYV